MKPLFFSALLLFAPAAGACVNIYSEVLAGMLYSLKSQREYMVPEIRKLEVAHARRATLQSANDLAAAYIIFGDYQKAIALLQGLEKKHPGLAKTAANLGTALELNGNNAEALHWIREGIRRDRNEHEGTEWLHVKVLEAKIAVARDPGWLSKHTVLGIDFGTKNGAKPRAPASLPTDAQGKRLTLPAIEKALKYQLEERTRFVAAPDPYMASLFLDRGHVAEVSNSPMASEYYRVSRLYATGKLDRR